MLPIECYLKAIAVMALIVSWPMSGMVASKLNAELNPVLFWLCAVWFFSPIAALFLLAVHLLGRVTCGY